VAPIIRREMDVAARAAPDHLAPVRLCPRPPGTRAGPGVAVFEPITRERWLRVTTFLAGAGVMLAALYLVGFGALAIAVPEQVSGYLHGFAGSMRSHMLELVIRLAAGAAFVEYASQMQFTGAFHLLGRVLIITTLGLAVLPWRWHRRFAQLSVPVANPYLPLMGLVSIAAGAFVFWAVASRLSG
jgi:uncharacterized protein YjeT (DUF2065 family)